MCDVIHLEMLIRLVKFKKNSKDETKINPTYKANLIIDAVNTKEMYYIQFVFLLSHTNIKIITV